MRSNATVMSGMNYEKLEKKKKERKKITQSPDSIPFPVLGHTPFSSVVLTWWWGSSHLIASSGKSTDSPYHSYQHSLYRMFVWTVAFKASAWGCFYKINRCYNLLILEDNTFQIAFRCLIIFISFYFFIFFTSNKKHTYL